MGALRIGGACAALACFFFGSTASATPVEITGWASGNFYRFDVTSSDFTYHIDTAEGPYVVALCHWMPCDAQAEYSGGVPSVQFVNTARLGDQHALQTGGDIRVLFRLEQGGDPDRDPFTATVPIQLFAQITAYEGELASTNRGGPLFAVAFQGTGDAMIRGRTFTDGLAVVQGLEFTIQGTFEQIPEPAAWMLAAAGLLALAVFRTRRT